MNIEWLLSSFDQLSPGYLYKILRLRNEVFVVEQQCVFQDADNNDQASYHFFGLLDQQIVAYTRLVPPGVIYEQPSIGRVVTSPAVRRSGIGKVLMEKSIEQVYILFGHQPIKIGAQLYLKKFYESLGFKQVGSMYLEDGIEHIYMLKKTES